MTSSMEWTEEEFARFTERMRLFKEDPESLSPEVYGKCKELHAEIGHDAKLVVQAIEENDVESLSDSNPKRAELADWLAKTP